MHLTYHDSDTHTGTASTAKAGEAGAPVIEITPEMIEAGVDAYYASSDIDEEMVKAVFMAMRTMEDSTAKVFRVSFGTHTPEESPK